MLFDCQLLSLFPWYSTFFSEESKGFPDVHVFNVKLYIWVYVVLLLLYYLYLISFLFRLLLKLKLLKWDYLLLFKLHSFIFPVF
jgi:hypothetical protein